jgi:hypothetical protein
MKPRWGVAGIAVVLFAQVGAACTSGGTSDRSSEARDATAGSERDAARDTSVPGAPTDAGTGEVSVAPLPAALKGYELYAWDPDGLLSFTLITGTNREKTLEEIAARNQNTTDGEWVVVSGEGQAELRALLRRIPEGTSVVLATMPGLPPLSEAARNDVLQWIAGSP